MDGSGTIEETAQGNIICKGVTFPPLPGALGGKLRRALQKGHYRADAASAVLRCAVDGDRVVEFGTGIGLLSALAAQHRDLDALHCYEPNPALIPYLRDLHAANNLSGIELTPAQPGKRKGSAKFYLRGAPHLDSGAPLPQDTQTPPEEIKTDVVNAKQVLKDTEASLLIATLNGAEADLLPELDLSNLRAAIVALSPAQIGAGGIARVFAALHGAGLVYYPLASLGKTVTFMRG
ncbi:MAG: hypothetical protein ACSHWZ_06935 [Sulfitobacter sp.]